MKSFILKAMTGDRNNSERSVGYEFKCLADMVVTAVGRPLNNEMNESHDIRIWNASTRMMLAIATVTSASPLNDLGFKVAALDAMLKLKAGNTYSIVSAERIGGDNWADTAALSSSPDGSVIRSVYTDADDHGGFPNLTAGSAGSGFVGVTFFYSLPVPGVPFVALHSPVPQSLVELSRVGGWDTVDITFSSDTDFTRYVVMANGGGGHDIGRKAAGGGAGTAGSKISLAITSVDFEDMQIDRLWRLDVYVLGKNGVWSDGEREPEPIAVTGISIKIIPNKTAYFTGDSLTMSGIVVTLSYGDNTTEDIAYTDFADNGITAVPADGTVLADSDSTVVITHTESGLSAAQAITVTAVTVVTGVTVDPAQASVSSGGTRQFSAVVTTSTGLGDKSVTWSVLPSGSKSSVTSAGLLSVHNSQKKGDTITVRAASALDGAKYADAIVTVA